MTDGSTMTVGSLQIRPAESDDRRFLKRLYGTTRDDISELGWTGDVTQVFIAAQFHAQTEHYRRTFPEACDQIVLLEEEPIGRLLTDQAAGVIRIVDIAFLPSHRGQGIGGRVLRAVCDRARQRGDAVRLSVAVGNRAAELYERLGFVVTRRHPIYLAMEWRDA